jgi:DNA-binding NtrC family response regulator
MILSRVVIASKDSRVHQLARLAAKEIFVADNLNEASDIAKTVQPELMLFDDLLTPSSINEFQSSCRAFSKLPIVVVANSSTDEKTISEFMQAGAFDYLNGQDDHDRIKSIAQKISGNDPAADEQADDNIFFAEDFAATVSMVGRSKAMLNTLKMLKLVASSRCNPVLIVGETGTGKELAAKAIHNLRHPDEEFVAVNCAALTANLLESELFGHVKGSFTGADREKVGLLEIAGQGSIFLDEISEMPLELQAKLLRVLQERTFRRVGGVKDIRCNATIIASSNRNLRTEANEKRFRQDLYYRLNTCPIKIEPLRSPKRREDIELLVKYFIKTSNICPDKSGQITSITKLAIKALMQYDWPGNVRELRNTIDRAILLETTDKIGLDSIIIDPTDLTEAVDAEATDKITDFSLEKAEKELIARALQETGWQKTRAAALLGITRATLYAKVKQYNIEQALSNAQDKSNSTSIPSELVAV